MQHGEAHRAHHVRKSFRIAIVNLFGREGAPKILKKCTLPLTGVNVVDTIVTEMAYIRVTKRGLVLEEAAPGLTAEDVQGATEARLIVSEHLKVMES